MSIMETEFFEYTRTIDNDMGLHVIVNKVGGGTIGHEYQGYWDCTLMYRGTPISEERINTPMFTRHDQIFGQFLDFLTAYHEIGLINLPVGVVMRLEDQLAFLQEAPE